MSQKEQERFLELYRPVHDSFERYCRARAFDHMPAEDLIHECLLIAYKKRKEIRNPSAFLSFLIGISRRVLANARKKRRAGRMEEERISNVADPTDYEEQRLNVAFLHHALAQLPDPQREAIILFEITGLSIKEIMNLQDSSESAVKQRLSRGRKTLAMIVKQELNISNTGKI